MIWIEWVLPTYIEEFSDYFYLQSNDNRTYLSYAYSYKMLTASMALELLPSYLIVAKYVVQYQFCG